MHLTIKKIIFIFSFTYASLHASPSDKASIIVLDASGSMWGQLKDGRSKIEVAREVMSEYLKKRDATAPLGLVVYGHRKRGDCADIEMLSAVKVQDAKKLSKVINAIQPKGKTPLTDALALAVKQIPRTAEEADIILITDGLETCDQDPCALAEKIANEGIDIRAHVVGFGLSEKEVNTLACIPKKTGGKLLRPQSGKELIEALEEVEKPIVKVESSKPKKVAIRIRIIPNEGTSRPTWVELSAKNLDSNETVFLAKRQDAKELIEYLDTSLMEGKWMLYAKGELGFGELNVTLQNRADYNIPFEASKASFSLENYGAYQLGQQQSFLLSVDNPLQKNKTLKVMLTPKGAKSYKEIIASSYLFGGTMGLHEFSFKSPLNEGIYTILVTPDYPKNQIASFDVEYVKDATPRIEIPKEIKAGESVPYKLYGNWYRNNTLFILEKEIPLSEKRLQDTIRKNGIFLEAPKEDGFYEIHYRYENAEKEMVMDKLTTFRIGEVLKKKEIKKEVKETSEEETNSTEPFFVPMGEVLTQEEIDAMMQKIMKDAK